MQLPTQVKAQKSKNVIYLPPSGDFSTITLDAADEAWISKTTGNTISYLSDCSGKNDGNLESLQNESLNALNDLKIIETKELSFNSRAALSTVANGKLDGVSVAIKILTFKKNNCNYNITYAGISEKFDKELSDFDAFLKNFKAP